MSSNTDVRGWRIALLPAALCGQAAAAAPPFDVLAVLDRCGYGLLQLPPAGRHSLLLAVIADQIAEYSHHGYAVAAIGLSGAGDGGLHWRRLAPLLEARGAPLPPRHFIRTPGDADEERARLSAFLSDYDLPEPERRRWRS